MNKRYSILFSESEGFYRKLGLADCNKCIYEFDGMRKYKHEAIEFESYDLFVCAFYTMPHNSIITHKFHNLGKKTALCADGVFDFSNSFNNVMLKKYDMSLFHPIMQMYFLCVGDYEYKYFSHLCNVIKYRPKRMFSSELIALKSADTKVLVTTANTAYFDDLDFERLVNLLVGVCQLLVEKNVDFSFRIFDEKLLNSMKDFLGEHVENDTAGSFEECLASYSHVISTPSSIVLTSMYHQRPVVTLCYRDFPFSVQSGWMISSSQMFVDSFDSFISSDHERIDIQEKLISTLSQDNLSCAITKILADKQMEKKFLSLECYFNKSMYNMLNSKFNFNFEWFVRRVYCKLNRLEFIKRIRVYVKW
ncbi:conserved hypothetical protein [Vibrio chagasii]|nr:conserved hypothetical protein [Vibrio chagasii]